MSINQHRETEEGEEDKELEADLDSMKHMLCHICKDLCKNVTGEGPELMMLQGELQDGEPLLKRLHESATLLDGT